MNERIAQYQERLKLTWGQMGRKQKIWLGASVAGLILAIVLLTIVFTKTDYELAFQNLDATDAAAVINYLDGSGIPYELSNGGTSISVPSAVASKVRIDTGSQGLVQNGSIGFGIFSSNSSSLGTTENEFKVIYQDALNGEIQKLLNGLQGVESSKVLINSPPESVFLTTADAPQATAAIVMKFEPGYRPSQKEIDGYYNLVKATVSDLAIKDITISSTQQGELRSSEAGGIASGNTDAIEMQFLIQQTYESQLKSNIQQFLGPIVGVDNLVVSVSSAMNFDKVMSQENRVEPLVDNDNNGIVVSEELINESSEGSSGDVGGVAGVGETDIPGYDGTTQSGSSSELNSQVRNYEFDRITKNIESGPFVVRDLSISVGIEESALLDANNRTDIMNYLSTLVRSQLANSGQNVDDDAVIERKVSLLARSFSGTTAATTTSGISTTWAIGLGIVALLLIGGLIAVIVRKRRKVVVEEEMTDLPTKQEYPSIDLESVQNDSQARKNLETLAKKKPDEFVNLLRTWLVDE